eukprot:4355555-Pyramimonas_sp.AAC.2
MPAGLLSTAELRRGLRARGEWHMGKRLPIAPPPSPPKLGDPERGRAAPRPCARGLPFKPNATAKNDS